MSGSGISWAICKSAPRSRQITTPALHYSSFLQARCPSCRPTNSVKALKARVTGTNKAYLSAITVTNISQSFYLKDGGKNQLAQIWNKLCHGHSMYSIRCGHCYIYSVVHLRLCLLAQGTITVLDEARIYHYKRHFWGANPKTLVCNWYY